MAKTPVKSVLDDIAERGQAQRDKATAALEDVLAAGLRGTEALTQLVRREVERQLRALGLRPAHNTGVAKPVKKAGSKSSGQRSAAKKTTAKKPAAKKPAAKKPAAKKTAAKKPAAKKTAKKAGASTRAR